MSEPVASAVPGGASGTRAVDRAADLVATVVRADEPLTFADLQDASGLAKSTTSRMLTALERSGLLERDAAGSYVAGRLFWLYAARHDPWEELVRLARPAMDALGEETGETVHLSVTRGDRVVQVAQVDSTYLLGTRDWTEVDVPAHCSALGKVFLAWGTLAVPDGDLERPTPATLTSPEALRREGDRVRERGWALTADELEIGLTGDRRPRLRGARRRGGRPRHLRAHPTARGAARRARRPPAGARHPALRAAARRRARGPRTAHGSHDSTLGAARGAAPNPEEVVA